MIFYHGTTEEAWEQIQNEGILFGRRYVLNNDGTIHHEVSRCTYLAVDKEEAECYGNVILKIEYNPFEHPKKNNYVDGCWQIRVYEPIKISNICKL